MGLLSLGYKFVLLSRLNISIRFLHFVLTGSSKPLGFRLACRHYHGVFSHLSIFIEKSNRSCCVEFDVDVAERLFSIMSSMHVRILSDVLMIRSRRQDWSRSSTGRHDHRLLRRRFDAGYKRGHLREGPNKTGFSCLRSILKRLLLL